MLFFILFFKNAILGWGAEGEERISYEWAQAELSNYGQTRARPLQYEMPGWVDKGGELLKSLRTLDS